VGPQERPQLRQAQGGTALADFISSKRYLNFTTANQKLGPGIGFWVNVP
jgi:hypothetical protein